MALIAERMPYNLCTWAGGHVTQQQYDQQSQATATKEQLVYDC
jgi:hypothetical protein